MTDWPAVTLIVLNWNARPFLPAALGSLQAQDYPDYRVVVVDNDSTDGSPEWIEDQFPSLTLYRLNQNLGFAAGNNVALRRLETPLAALVNPDVRVAPDWLRGLVRPFVDDPAVGVAGCLLTYDDGRTVQHAGGIIRWPRAQPDHIGLGQPERGQFDAVRDVDYVIGAAMAVRRDLLQAIGLLDEGFFLYYEDADFCFRARRAGYRVVFAPGARLVHLESVLTGKGSPAYLRQMHSGRWRFLLKHAAPQTVLAETLPAERDWLAGLDRAQRQAAAVAYLAALRRLPAIWRARVRDGGTAVPPSAHTAVADGLAALLGQARQPGAGDVSAGPGAARLLAAARVEERPFRSSVPLVGPLLAGFRALWNRAATRAYLRPLLAQQNEFNALVAQQLDNYERLLAEQAAQLAAADARFGARARRAADAPPFSLALDEVGAELAVMYRRLGEVDGRLGALERKAEDDAPSR